MTGSHKKSPSPHYPPVDIAGPVAIVGGTGAEGRGLAQRWARAGLEVIIGSRDAARARDSAASLREKLGDTTRVLGTENAEAVRASKVVVLAVPFPGHADTLNHLRPHFQEGTVLIDTTVPLATGIGGHATRTVGVWQGSAAQQAAEMVPPGVAVVAAFQNISAVALARETPLDSDVIICADDPHAGAVAAALARKIPGVRPVDGGKLENARIMEQLTALLIAINVRNKVRSVGLRITGLPDEAAK